MDVMEKQIIFAGGKGGVGKSTSAAALALRAAEQNEKTLLISTDPAHNIGHIFEQKIGGHITSDTDNLDDVEIEPAKETPEYIKDVKSNIKNVVQPTMMEEAHRQLDSVRASPGADEVALFDKLLSII